MVFLASLAMGRTRLQAFLWPSLVNTHSQTSVLAMASHVRWRPQEMQCAGVSGAPLCMFQAAWMRAPLLRTDLHRQCRRSNVRTCKLCIIGYGGSGGLGDGQGTDSNTPVDVTGDHVFTAISAGDWHTCALEASGQALCWGEWSYQCTATCGL